MSVTKFSFSSLKDIETTPTYNLQAILLAPQGGGKSTCISTLTGTLLYLHGPDEKHGPEAADGGRATIKKINWGVHPTTREPLSNTDGFNYLTALLNKDLIEAEGITGIVIDGFNSLEKLVRGTSYFKAACTSKKGEHNSFAETGATVELIDQIFHKIFLLQEQLKLDFLVTGIVDTKSMSDNGEYLEVQPQSTGYSVAVNIIRQFGDVLLIGPVSVKTKEGIQKGHCFQFNSTVTKVQKDIDGNVKKYLNFNPRVTRRDKTAKPLPALLKADLDAIKALKAK